MEHAILEVVSDCDVESWRHLLKDIGLTNVFEYGVPSLGLPTMDLWSGTLDIRDRCFLLLLGSTLVPKNTCVSFVQSISHVRAAPQHFFLAQQSKSETFVLVLEATPTLPARQALAQYVILNLVTAVICDNSMRIVSVRDARKRKSAGSFVAFEKGGCADENWWTSYCLLLCTNCYNCVGWTWFNLYGKPLNLRKTRRTVREKRKTKRHDRSRTAILPRSETTDRVGTCT